VSQGAVSRLEMGRGLATPLLIVLRIYTALASGLRDVDPTLLSDPLRRMAEEEDITLPGLKDDHPAAARPLTPDPILDTLIPVVRDATPQRRALILALVEAASAECRRP
jgi:hypothetical protein